MKAVGLEAFNCDASSNALSFPVRSDKGGAAAGDDGDEEDLGMKEVVGILTSKCPLCTFTSFLPIVAYPGKIS